MVVYMLKPENLRRWTIPIRFLSDVPISRNWHNTVSKLKIYVRITWPEFPPMAVQYTGHLIQTETRDHNTALRLIGVFSRQEHQIDVLYVSINSWENQVSAYTPFHFSFTVPYSKNKNKKINENLLFLLKYQQSWNLWSYHTLFFPLIRIFRQRSVKEKIGKKCFLDQIVIESYRTVSKSFNYFLVIVNKRNKSNINI